MGRFCLNIHARYRCASAGACCTAGWNIPAEPDVARALELHFVGADRAALFKTASPRAPDPQAILATRPDHACVFLERKPGGLCAIHRELGPGLLPSACRHFPRVALRDGRGLHVTLSHFCPTAAALLFRDQPLAIVEAPATLTLDDAVEGLEAGDALPPLLRPGLLMDLDGYDRWEQCAIGALVSAGSTADAALTLVAAATADAQRWSPGGGSLASHVARAFEHATPTDGSPDATSDLARYSLALSAVPRGLARPTSIATRALTRPEVAAVWAEHDHVVRRYLAAKLFANWYAWQGLGVATALEAIRVHAAVLRVEVARRVESVSTSRAVLLEAIRAADLLMVHLVDSATLARSIDRREHGWLAADRYRPGAGPVASCR